MFGRREHALDLALLDDLPALHDADPVRDLADDAEIVGYEQHRHTEPLLRVPQQFQDLRLHGNVERRGRFIGDQEVRLVSERHGDHHTLALPARELVRIAAKPAFWIGDADLAQQFEHAGAHDRSSKPLMQQQNLTDLFLDRVQRIERGHRLLKYDADVVAAHVPDFLLWHGQQLAAIEADRTGRMMRRRIGQ